MKAVLRSMGLAVVLILAPTVSQADKPDDAHALEGVETGKVAWDITLGNPKKLLLFLKVIDETYDDLVRQGVEPDMVFTFHGPVLKLLVTDGTDVPLDQEETYDAIARLLDSMMAKPGVRTEACSVAARLLELDTSELLPGIHVVGNTFVSQIGYQAKGYAIIPIH